MNVRVVHKAYYIVPIIGTTSLLAYLPRVVACSGNLITHMSVLTFTCAKRTNCEESSVSS